MVSWFSLFRFATGTDVVLIIVGSICASAMGVAFGSIETTPFCVGSVFSSTAFLSWLNNNGSATATDNCGTVTWSNNYGGMTMMCGNTEFATVIFTATDECGNTSTTEATFGVVDTTPPNIDSMPMDLTLECDGLGNVTEISDWLNSQGGAMASDVCGNVTWTHDFNGLSDDCGATGSATVTFTAMDECGNSNETTATFIIEDTTPPAWTRPTRSRWKYQSLWR